METAQAILKRFINYIEKVHAAYPDKPIWITEFNANINRTSANIHEMFMKLATEWMDNQDHIERYSYFFPKPLPENNTDNSLSDIGKYWQSLPSSKSINKNIIGDAVLIR
jgi:Glycosyl hydrolase catalytic core